MHFPKVSWFVHMCTLVLTKGGFTLFVFHNWHLELGCYHKHSLMGLQRMYIAYSVVLVLIYYKRQRNNFNKVSEILIINAPVFF